MTLGAVYQHLSDLEEKGLVTSQAEGKRRLLKITEKGRRFLEVLDDLRILL
jgi:predicted transcriptional regulator